MARRGRKPKLRLTQAIAGPAHARPADDSSTLDGGGSTTEHDADVARLVAVTSQAFDRLGLSGPAIHPALRELFIDAAERWFAARASLKTIGPTVDSAFGSLKPNPCAVQAAKAHDQLLRLLEQCGLTPAAYLRLGARPDADDELDVFLGRTGS